MEKDRSAIVLNDLADLAVLGPDDLVSKALQIVRQHVDMDVSYVSRFTDGSQVLKALDGAAESFGFSEGSSLPLSETYCSRMATGLIPNAIPDTSLEPGVSSLPVTQDGGIGSYLGIPLTLSDGRLYGSLCCISHAPTEDLRSEDVRVMQIIGRLIAFSVEQAETAQRAVRLRTEAATVRALSAAIEARDGYTAAHSDSVLVYSLEVAEALGLSAEEISQVGQVAILHDVGKVGIPDEILRKESALTDEEWRIMKDHTIIGHNIVSSIEGLSHLANAVRAEHERWDGTGYPDRLSGDDIPMASRIVLVCDAFHAMVSDRPYRNAMTITAALDELQENSGTQFCPAVVDAFMATRAGEKELRDGKNRPTSSTV